jgi:hypothetical protein
LFSTLLEKGHGAAAVTFFLLAGSEEVLAPQLALFRVMCLLAISLLLYLTVNDFSA